MQKNALLIFISLALILTACGSKSATPSLHSPMATEAPATQAPMLGAEVPAPAPTAVSLDAYKSSGSGGTAAAGQSRMVTTNVDLNIVVADPQKKIDEVSQLAKSLGGYVVSMNMGQVITPNGNTAPQGTITIRVPSSTLESAVTQIKAGAINVPSENWSSQDVTSQYVDLQSQLNNLQKAEQDLLEIMDEAKNNPGNNSTTKTQDVLNVYNQIVSIRGQIEQIQGQMKYIEETTSTSLINVTIVAEATIKPIEIGGWKPQGVARDAIQALVRFLEGFVNFIIWLVLLALPVMIIIFGPIALIIWAIVAGLKRRKARKAKAQ